MIQYIASGDRAYGNGSGNITVQFPSEYRDKDVAIMFAWCLGAYSITTPSGWTADIYATLDASLYVFYKVLNGTQSSVTVAGGSNYQSAQIMIFRGVNNTTPIMASASDGQATNAYVLTLPAVTVTAASSLLVSAVSSYESNNGAMKYGAWAFASSNGLFEISDQPAKGGQTSSFGAMVSYTSITSGTTGTGSVTQELSRKATMITLALNPATEFIGKKQYRLATTGNWTSNYGYAFLAITNPSGSGKKITLRSLEAQISSSTPAVSGTIGVTATLYRCAGPVRGESMVTKHVTTHNTATAIPTGVVIRRSSVCESYTSKIKRFHLTRRSAAAGTQNNYFASPRTFGFSRKGQCYRSSVGSTNSTIESLAVNDDEAYVLVVDNNDAMPNSPIRVSISFTVGSRGYTCNFVALPMPGLGIFSIENTTGTNNVKLISIAIDELGTSDTPTIRVVPIGQQYAGDILDASKTQGALQKMDSSYPTLGTDSIGIYSDIGFIPYGVPEEYFAPGSAGSPKGVNYLHTRDFQGPMYRNFLPEMTHITAAAKPDMLGLSYSHRCSDLLVRRAGITLNPGEGIALVSSAETMVAVQAAYSGWPAITFCTQLDVEPQYSPTLVLTGLVDGSDLVFLVASTSIQVLDVDANAGTTYSWAYNSDSISAVDIAVYKTGYKPLVLKNVILPRQGGSIPVLQTIDRSYA